MQFTIKGFEGRIERLQALSALNKYEEQGLRKNGPRNGCAYRFEDGTAVYIYRTMTGNIVVVKRKDVVFQEDK